MRHARQRRLVGPASAIIACAALTCACSVAWAETGRTCIGVEPPWSFATPDGTVHPAGAYLRICHLRYSPATGLYVVDVDGSSADMLMGRIRPSEATGLRPIVVFDRDDAGVWRLVGYTTARGNGSRSHALFAFNSGAHADSDRSVSFPATAARIEAQPEVRVR